MSQWSFRARKTSADWPRRSKGNCAAATYDGAGLARAARRKNAARQRSCSVPLARLPWVHAGRQQAHSRRSVRPRRRPRLRAAISGSQARPQLRRDHGRDRRQATRGAPRTRRLRRHEEAAGDRGLRRWGGYL